MIHIVNLVVEYNKFKRIQSMAVIWGLYNRFDLTQKDATTGMYLEERKENSRMKGDQSIIPAFTASAATKNVPNPIAH